jgi:hypothetical protein
MLFCVLLLSTACKKNVPAAGETNGVLNALFRSVPETGPLTPADYIEWCENEANGLKQTKEIGDFKFSAFMTPVDYLALKELKQDELPDAKKVAAGKKEYEGLTYFSFRIENTKQQDELLKINLSSDNEYYGRLEYFSFKMQQDFKLIAGNDTVACGLYHFERIYGLAPYATFVVGFPATSKNEDLKLWYHDNIFNNGIIILNFNKEIVNHLPKLKM